MGAQGGVVWWYTVLRRQRHDLIRPSTGYQRAIFRLDTIHLKIDVGTIHIPFYQARVRADDKETDPDGGPTYNNRMVYLL